MKTAIAALALFIAPLACTANQGRTMPFTTIRYEVEEGPAGKIVVEAKQNRDGLSAVRITAFGKEIALTKEQLSKLPAGIWNGIRVVSDAGILGRFVSIQFERGFSAGLSEQVVLLVSSNGSVEVLNLKKG